MTDDTGTSSVTVRYWAAARSAAGLESERHEVGDSATVGSVLDACTQAHAGLARVIPVSSILVEGVRAERDDPVRAGVTVEVLPPFAGG